MQPPAVGLWARYPGQVEAEPSSSEDDESPEDQEVRERAARLRPQVLETLGDAWEELPCVDFEPAPEPHVDQRKKGTVVSKLLQQHEAISRWPFLVGRNSSARTSPLLFRIVNICAQVVQETFLANGFLPTESRDWLVQWSGPGMKQSAYRGLHEHQHVNHFPGSTELTRKDRLWTNFHEMSKTFGKEAFDFVPETYVLPEQMDKFLQSSEQQPGQIWIVKPSAKSQGRGIYLLKDPKDLPAEPDETMVVSRYVANPLLIQGLKFDLRIYVLVTSFEPLRAYVYREGIARFASSPYSTSDEHIKDTYRHLTNYSINKGSKNFVENQNVCQDNCGHKWSLSALNKHLLHVGENVELMWTRIMDLIVKSLLSVQRSVSATTRENTVHESNCFELYGFDVLVDEDLKPWLLEVNLSPSMQAESPLDWQIKSSLLSDTFTLVGIGKADAKAVAAARLRSKLLQIRRQAYSDNDLQRTGFRQQHAEGLSSPSMPTSFDDENRSYQALFSKLEKGELKMLARALGEVMRQRNFIRLFPTRSTMMRYETQIEAGGAAVRRRQAFGLTSPAALLAAVMLGMPLTRDEAELASGPRPLDVGSGDFSAAARQLRAFPAGSASASRLLLLEYVVRISRACQACAPSRKVAVDKDWPAARRLQEFTARLLDHVDAQLDPTPKDMKTGIVVARLGEACRIAIARLSRIAATSRCTEQELQEMESPASSGCSVALVQDVPSRRTLASLRTLGAKELEAMFSRPDRQDVGHLIENYEDMSPTGQSQATQNVTGPLSELLLFITQSASEVVGSQRHCNSLPPVPAAARVKGLQKAVDQLTGLHAGGSSSLNTALAMDTGAHAKAKSTTALLPQRTPSSRRSSLVASGKALAGLAPMQANTSSCPLLPELSKAGPVMRPVAKCSDRHWPSFPQWSGDPLHHLRKPSPAAQPVLKWPFTACNDIEL